ncbi:MAG: response regulator [Thermoflexales bacterium]|nr:response regulator [Thermoflexales bacterium]
MSHTALVIEDDVDLSTIFTEAMQMAGFEVETIRDGSKAQARLAETTPDLIILDLHLPNVSGKDLLAQIRADARLAKARIILATADARLADMLDETEKDLLVLVKPISFGQLRDMAKRLKASMSLAESAS